MGRSRWRNTSRRKHQAVRRFRQALPSLFDEGYITFSASQELVIVPEARDKLLDAWGIDAGVRVGQFSPEQNAYLEYHRANVFKRQLLDG